MSDPAQTVRLHILLCDGLSGLSRIVDRLAVVGVVPLEIVFRRGPGERAFLHLELDGVSPGTVASLVLRLRQVVAVSCVRVAVRNGGAGLEPAGARSPVKAER